MRIEIFAKEQAGNEALGEQFSQWLSRFDAAPNFVALHQSVETLDADLCSFLPDTVPVHGATSCRGVMAQDGPHLDAGAGAFVIWDPEGDYGSGLEAIIDDPRDAARRAAEAALLDADRPGEAPTLVWVSASPGQEEEILHGIADVVGSRTPVLGGSAADNTVSGEWRVFTHGRSETSGVVVSVMFPSSGVSFAYHNGYAPTEHTGTVTSASGRTLQEIDGRPAAEVYREWTGGRVIPEEVNAHLGILSDSTMNPLGSYLDSVSDVPYFLLAHPAAVTPEGTLELFANVQVGTKLTLMQGAPEQLTQRAGKVAALAAETGSIRREDAAGMLMVYCGGCMLAVQDHLKDVTDGVEATMTDVPYLGIFTFGEQGVALDGRNRHGNLMISAVVFES